MVHNTLITKLEHKKKTANGRRLLFVYIFFKSCTWFKALPKPMYWTTPASRESHRDDICQQLGPSVGVQSYFSQLTNLHVFLSGYLLDLAQVLAFTAVNNDSRTGVARHIDSGPDHIQDPVNSGNKSNPFQGQADRLKNHG